MASHPAHKHGTSSLPQRRVPVRGDASRNARQPAGRDAENLTMTTRTGTPAVTGPAGLPGQARGGTFKPAGGARLRHSTPADANPC